MNKHIVVEVAPDGSVKIEAVNFKGADCEKATKFLDEALGMVEKRQRKPEYYKKAEQQAKAGR